LEDDRVIVRCRVRVALGLSCLLLTASGCSDRFLAGPMYYVENDALTKDIKGKSNLAGKPKLQDKVRIALARLYGDSPTRIKVPEGMGAILTKGGAYLGNYLQTGEGTGARIRPIAIEDPKTQEKIRITGGYGVYRRQCLHCHGVSGAGDGPTSPFLYPTPRDYRRGLFKFTSTPYGARPHRDDLRRTVRNGLHGTSMPAFEALLSDFEIEQVIDYITFLSIRGETELSLIDEGLISDENDPQALSPEVARDIALSVFNKWKTAQTAAVNPPSPRTASTRDSVLRGRELFLGRTAEKLDCTGCHGAHARGDGPTFVSQDVFNRVVFGGNPSEREERLKEFDEKVREIWNQKLDDWGDPIRPANLNRGVYKGGRRPLDLYWRISKGITGANMPPAPGFSDHNKIWDLVNFVLALPYEPDLLKDATLPSGTQPPLPSVANR
jgi:mono/diheme cytochrome c family protein